MTFDSLAFLIFLPVVVGIYWLLPHKARQIWLLAASYFFYMYWNPVLIWLLLLSTVIDYVCSLGIARHRENKKLSGLFLAISIFMNLGLLFSFKYFDFFAQTVNGLCQILAVPYRVPALNLILPVGISFYTFQTMSYTIDVYRGNCPAERNFVTYALYVTFFPQLVAGPIERSANLLPQLKGEHRFSREDIREGCRLLLSGFFRKVVIADGVAKFVDAVYGFDGVVDGAAVVMSTALFAVQIYCDFAGYSEIAAGSARLMGIRLMRNFDQPYLAASVREFWRRWHISLSTWFTDYIYIPLGGSRKGLPRQIFATLVVFAVSGLWHGAKWTFVIWGLIHGIYMVAEILLRHYFGGKTGVPDTGLKRYGKMALTFCATLFAWIFFRSQTLEQAFSFLGQLVSPWDFALAAKNLDMTWLDLLQIFLMIAHLPGLHRLSRSLDIDGKPARHPDVVYVYYLTVIVLAWLIRLEANVDSVFIYFQF